MQSALGIGYFTALDRNRVQNLNKEEDMVHFRNMHKSRFFTAINISLISHEDIFSYSIEQRGFMHCGSKLDHTQEYIIFYSA